MPKIRRVPIKIRKPIFIEFCSCWGIKTFSVEGVPRTVLGDGLTVDMMSEFLKITDVMLPVMFTGDQNIDLIQLCLDNKIPVSITTDHLLDEDLITKIKDVPHSSIYISSTFGNTRSREFLRMMAYAKSHKILIGLSIKYFPHGMNLMDVYESIDGLKNYISHITVSIPDISDDDIHDNSTDLKRLKKHYMPNISSREWVPKPNTIENVMDKLSLYVKGKKISIEYIYPPCSDGRYRQVKYKSKEPLGMRGFYYKKIDSKFEASETFEGFDCPKCEKPIFT